MTKEEIQKEIKRLKNILLQFSDTERKMRACRTCGEQVRLAQRRCPNCKDYTTDKYERVLSKQGNIRMLSKRNNEIVTKMKTGLYTLEQLGEEYGVSRERIRQIYLTQTGETGSTYRLLYLRKLQEARKEEKGKQIKFSCAGCGKEATYTEAHHKSKYCVTCHKIRKEKGIRLTEKKLCYNCGITFSPHANYNSPSQRARGIYHNHNCYMDVRRATKLLREYYIDSLMTN